jgi:hypothetical protein
MWLSKYSLDRTNTISSMFRTQYSPDFFVAEYHCLRRISPLLPLQGLYSIPVTSCIVDSIAIYIMYLWWSNLEICTTVIAPLHRCFFSQQGCAVDQFKRNTVCSHSRKNFKRSLIWYFGGLGPTRAKVFPFKAVVAAPVYFYWTCLPCERENTHTREEPLPPSKLKRQSWENTHQPTLRGVSRNSLFVMFGSITLGHFELFLDGRFLFTTNN